MHFKHTMKLTCHDPHQTFSDTSLILLYLRIFFSFHLFFTYLKFSLYFFITPFLPHTKFIINHLPPFLFTKGTIVILHPYFLLVLTTLNN